MDGNFLRDSLFVNIKFVRSGNYPEIPDSSILKQDLDYVSDFDKEVRRLKGDKN